MVPDPPHPGKALVDRCLAGDAAAWEAFVRGYSPAVERSVLSTLKRFGVPSDRAPDLVQEVFARLADPAASPLRRFRWECALSQLLSVIAIRRTLAFLHRERAGSGALDAVRLLGDLDPAGDSPERGLEWEETAEKLGRALERLPARERLAIQLAYWHGQPADRIGRVLGVSRNAAWQVLHQARLRLRDLLRTLPGLLM